MNKKKEGDTSVDNGEILVYDYILKQNRPYSMNDIAQNLYKDIGKTGAQKVLDKLVRDGKIIEKLYGKQKIYFMDQTCLSEANPDEIKALDVQIESLEKEIREHERGLKDKQTELRKITDSLPTDQLEKAVDELRESIAKKTEKLEHLKATTVVIDKNERELSRKRRNAFINAWRYRKGLCNDVVNAILENCPLPCKDLLAAMDVTTDEEEGVKIPALK